MDTNLSKEDLKFCGDKEEPSFCESLDGGASSGFHLTTREEPSSASPSMFFTLSDSENVRRLVSTIIWTKRIF